MQEKGVRRAMLLAMAVVVIGVLGFSISETVSVSNSVNGRELPIYCVQTEEKKVALSFDAAWGES